MGEMLLGIDTCGARGTVALGRVVAGGVEIAGQVELAGGEFAARIVAVIGELLAAEGLAVKDLAGIVAVEGPGTFTGIRIGLSTAKALAEATGVPIVTVSRLRLLAELAGTGCAALDAHRGQVFLGVYGETATEVLVTAGEFQGMQVPGAVAFCEEGVAQLLETVAEADLVRTAAPTAADALRLGLGRWEKKEFADVAELDGYYLRGADAKTQVALAADRVAKQAAR